MCRAEGANDTYPAPIPEPCSTPRHSPLQHRWARAQSARRALPRRWRRRSGPPRRQRSARSRWAAVAGAAGAGGEAGLSWVHRLWEKDTGTLHVSKQLARFPCPLPDAWPCSYSFSPSTACRQAAGAAGGPQGQGGGGAEAGRAAWRRPAQVRGQAEEGAGSPAWESGSWDQVLQGGPTKRRPCSGQAPSSRAPHPSANMCSGSLHPFPTLTSPLAGRRQREPAQGPGQAGQRRGGERPAEQDDQRERQQGAGGGGRESGDGEASRRHVPLPPGTLGPPTSTPLCRLPRRRARSGRLRRRRLSWPGRGSAWRCWRPT